MNSNTKYVAQSLPVPVFTLQSKEKLLYVLNFAKISLCNISLNTTEQLLALTMVSGLASQPRALWFDFRVEWRRMGIGCQSRIVSRLLCVCW